jgi:hypothetical protein
MEKEVKLIRLRDIVLYHLPGAKCEELDALERDIKVWAKNLLLSLDELNATASISFIGDNDRTKEAISTSTT